MREAQITRRILAALNAWQSCKAIKLHGSRYQEAGTPDILAVRHGRVYLLEVKCPGKKPTVLQARRLDEWTAAGATTAVVSAVQDAVDLVLTP